MSKLTTEQWILKAREVHGDKYDYSKVDYKSSKEKVCIICPKHGEFWQRADHHIEGFKCSKCRTLGIDKFIEKAKQIHGDKYDYSEVEYKNNRTNVYIICHKKDKFGREHGKFLLTPDHHFRGDGCPKCSGRYKRTVLDFIDESNLVHNNKYNYSKVLYIDTLTKVEIICPKHGSFWQTPGHHLKGDGCPKCLLKSQTKLYEKLKKSFPNEEILFEVGKEIVSWLDLQRFDIYFPKYNIAIEYNGIQHYIPVERFGGELRFKETKRNDKLKRLKCIENNCTLFEIKYNYNQTDYDSLISNINKSINKS